MTTDYTPHAKVFMFCNGYSDFASASIEWATGLLVNGYYTDNVAVVAGHVPPIDIHELRCDTLNALKDVGVTVPIDQDFTRLMAKALVKEMVYDSSSIPINLRILSDACLADDYSDYLYKFYLLWHAYDSLFNYDQDIQWYWDDIDARNFEEKSHEFFITWLESS